MLVHAEEVLSAEDTFHLAMWEFHLPWMTKTEREGVELRAHPDYPKGRDSASVKAFAVQLQATCERLVPCVFDTGKTRVSGFFDLVQGNCFVRGDQGLSLAKELPGCVHIELGAPAVETLRFIRVQEGRAQMEHLSPSEDAFAPPAKGYPEVLAQRVYTSDVESATQALADAGQLPAVTASFKGKRLGTFHPVA